MLDAIDRFGLGKWALISQELKNRTDNQVLVSFIFTCECWRRWKQLNAEEVPSYSTHISKKRKGVLGNFVGREKERSQLCPKEIAEAQELTEKPTTRTPRVSQRTRKRKSLEDESDDEYQSVVVESITSNEEIPLTRKRTRGSYTSPVQVEDNREERNETGSNENKEEEPTEREGEREKQAEGIIQQEGEKERVEQEVTQEGEVEGVEVEEIEGEEDLELAERLSMPSLKVPIGGREITFPVVMPSPQSLGAYLKLIESMGKFPEKPLAGSPEWIQSPAFQLLVGWFNSLFVCPMFLHSHLPNDDQPK